MQVQARTLCEKRLGEHQVARASSVSEHSDEQKLQELSFRAVMNSPFSRKYLYAFLESRTPPQQDLVRVIKAKCPIT